MNILTIPVRNMRRKWIRSLLLFLIFSLGVVSIVSLNYVSQVVGESLEKKLTAFGANILVSPENEKLTVSYGGFSLGEMLVDVHYLDEKDIDQSIEGIALRQNISVVAPKLVTTARINETPVGIVGVRWKREMILKGYWALKGAYPVTGDEVIAGARVAEKLKLIVGQEIRIKDRGVRVSGVLQPTGSDDDNVILAGIDMVQALVGTPGAVSFVEVAALCAGCPIEDIVAEIGEALPGTEVIALQSVVKQRMYSVTFVKKLILTVSVVILLIACGMVGMTMLSSVNERVREIGLLRSLGFSRQGIFSIFCFEAVFIGLAAGVVGYSLGYLLSLEVLAMLDMAEDVPLSFSLGHLIVTGAVIVGGSILSALFPAWKASNIEPSKALISL